ncbi:MAG: hypothetical protein SVP52_02625, partial [Chloroflexota bacterium]|nr:hypothetical protein [Chloroflexota bacterium]
MQRSTEKLYKIFKLEADFGYANKAVVGGLEKLTDTWAGEARADGLSEEDIQAVTDALNLYPNLDTQGRVHTLKKIGHILDIPGIKYLESPDKEENKPADEETQPGDEKSIASRENINAKSRGSTRKRAESPAPIPDDAVPSG